MKTDMFEKIDEIKAVLREAPTEAEMLELLAEIGLDYNEFINHYGKEKIENALLYSKDLKDRYSVLWLNYKYFNA